MKLKNTYDYMKLNDESVADFSLKYKTLKKGEEFVPTINKNSNKLPNFHLIPTSGLLNDPNGLHKDGEYYYIYYQVSPYKPFHLNKHWALYKTKDFINFEDKGIVIKPDQEIDAQGVFSGAAIVDEGETHIFYTGNLKQPNMNDLDRGATTVHYDKNKDEKTFLFEVDKNIYHGHFRDPFPFKKNGKKYMLNGAMLIGEKGTISIHESDSWDKNWKHTGSLNINGLDDCWMIECPSTLNINNKDLLIFSVMRTNQFKNQFKLDPVLYSVGNLNIDDLEFETEKLELVDYGYDFYAPQLFNDGKRDIMIGWLGNTFHGEYIDANDGFNGMLTIPREITLVENKLYQKPIDEFEQLISEDISNDEIKDRFNFVANEIKEDFTIEVKNSEDESFTIKHENRSLKLNFENSSKKESEIIIKNGEKIPSEIIINNIDVEDIRVIFDNSVVEIFINKGSKTITQRIYLFGDKVLESNLEYKLNNIKNININ